MNIECLIVTPSPDPDILKRQLKALDDFLPTHPFPAEGVVDDKKPFLSPEVNNDQNLNKLRYIFDISDVENE